jgi:hypothetical protein
MEAEPASPKHLRLSKKPQLSFDKQFSTVPAMAKPVGVILHQSNLAKLADQILASCFNQATIR